MASITCYKDFLFTRNRLWYYGVNYGKSLRDINSYEGRGEITKEGKLRLLQTKLKVTKIRMINPMMLFLVLSSI